MRIGTIGYDNVHGKDFIIDRPLKWMTFFAFLVSYAIGLLCGFLGMYLTIKKMTDSSILAVISGGCFCMLPLYPIYGLTQMGLPLLLYTYLCLREERRVKI